MKAIFLETTTFTATVGSYLEDDQYRLLQSELLANPNAGDVMPRTGGFRKLRWADERRGKGKRGGLRVIYYWLMGDGQFWMFAIYDKDELENLTADQEKALRNLAQKPEFILVISEAGWRALGARNLSIPVVTVVITYDFPNDVEDYVRRIWCNGWNIQWSIICGEWVTMSALQGSEGNIE